MISNGTTHRPRAGSERGCWPGMRHFQPEPVGSEDGARALPSLLPVSESALGCLGWPQRFGTIGTSPVGAQERLFPTPLRKNPDIGTVGCWIFNLDSAVEFTFLSQVTSYQSSLKLHPQSGWLQEAPSKGAQTEKGSPPSPKGRGLPCTVTQSLVQGNRIKTAEPCRRSTTKGGGFLLSDQFFLHQTGVPVQALKSLRVY